MTSTTHVDNLVEAISLALEGGKPGEAYFVTDGETPVISSRAISRQRALRRLTSQFRLGRASSRRRSPCGGMAGAKSPLPLTRFTAAIMSRDCTINDGKARAELEVSPGQSDAGIAGSGIDMAGRESRHAA
ncbi:MAG: hypothetical protein R3C55_17285 [Parvularculaceae bacterium]